ncbi:hypothetical protein VFA_003175 [Vibrio furnissii CIP 102972]|nr:hypothetical protein VFA_003175 [Vibrio furnissii CIP 102972]
MFTGALHGVIVETDQLTIDPKPPQSVIHKRQRLVGMKGEHTKAHQKYRAHRNHYFKQLRHHFFSNPLPAHHSNMTIVMKF